VSSGWIVYLPALALWRVTPNLPRRQVPGSQIAATAATQFLDDTERVQDITGLAERIVGTMPTATTPWDRFDSISHRVTGAGF